MPRERLRRDVLRGIGSTTAATMSTGIVAAGQRQLATADDETKRQIRTVLENLREITGDRKERLTSEAEDYDEYETLEKAITAENARVEKDEILVYESDELAYYFVVANYEVRDRNGALKDGEILIPLEQSNEDPTVNIETTLAPRAVVKTQAEARAEQRHHRTEPADTATGGEREQGVSIYLASGEFSNSAAMYREVEASSVRVGESGVSKMSAQSVQAIGLGWGCAACKDMVGLVINTVSCSLEGVVACAIITSQTGVGPVACPVAFAVICTAVMNEGINDPDDVCGGCDMWGNKMLDAPCTDCSNCKWWNPLC